MAHWLNNYLAQNMPMDLSGVVCMVSGFLIAIGLGIGVLVMAYKSGYANGKNDGLRGNREDRQTGFDVVMPEKKSEKPSGNDQR